MSRSTKPAVAARHAQAPRRVRIIGGQWKRTPIPLPAVQGLRPTPDRVRETVFNWLAHLRPDLFAEGRRPHPGPSSLGLAGPRRSSGAKLG
ncbi:MAG: RsmD family RNA methyltransferase, partial [Burkholderiales bacterium]|nr:RsmD family RNA methyltransferase [Burkholderiales bacterium]